PVDRRGVVFSGQTRAVVATGLTRPHSARLYRGQVWVDNSGYGEVGPLVAGRFEPFARLPGWTRGLYFHRGIAFVGTSRVIPRYRHYAPGVACETSEAAVHVLDLKSGKVLGCMSWPNGNQIFAIEGVPSAWTGGFPFSEERQSTGKRRTVLFFKGLAA
ncbi:MAG: DUF4915 domain-containing protein, partial [Planctomycetes bacterium]|nr:DUF4915 domain-containing protein [Planctomycetota bacterium]